ncbi:phage tail tape measure protein [Rosistilla oblonga]|uniref:Phage-related minor tail protein n=1 Tax=Rosistilla oblonga TaxID=2527990 RepID=A0A518IQW5_9BACT|nr:phage tail tape measure protein [Rosistilla oblonga]QDV55479.1 Phage-related minor tail protein [Rosistilla oblonga]
MSKSKVKAGEAYVEVGVRNRIAQGAKGVQQSLDQMSRRVAANGSLLGAVGLAMSAPFAYAANTFAGFDDAMRAVGGVTRATTADLAAMTDVARELGRTTSFSATEVAGLMVELGRAGFSPSQINDMTGAVLALSRATGTDATLSAGFMAASIRQFGLEATDAARVADSLAAAANGSFNSVEALGEALKYAGPVAADLGYSLEETLAVLGTLGNIGIQGSMAGTTLKRLSITVAAEAQKLEGIFGTSFRNMDGSAMGLVDTLGEIARATNGLDDTERVSKLNEAFGLLGITGASAIGKTAAETDKLLATLQAAGGVAAKTAADMDAGLGGAFRNFASAAEGAKNAIGEAFAPELQSVTKILTDALGGVTGWVEGNKEIVTVMAASGVGAIALGGGFLGVAAAAQVASVGIGVAMSTTAAIGSAFGVARTAMVGFKAATLSAAASIAFMRGGMAAMSTVIGLSTAAMAANSVVASAMTTAIGLAGSAMAALSAPMTLTTGLTGAVAAGWGLITTSATAAWTAMGAPAIPFIAAGAAVVAAITAIGAVATYAAVQSTDLSAAWGKATRMFDNSLQVISAIGGAMKAALGSGDYGLMAETLWASIEVVFWEGAEGVVGALGWMADEGWETVKRFLWNMLTSSSKVLSALVKAYSNPIGAATTLGSAIADLSSTSISIDVSENSKDARKRLDELKAKADAINAEKNKAAEQPTAGGAPGAPQAPGQPGAPGQPSTPQEEANDEYEKKLKAINDEIFALEHGEDAAMRKKLAEEGLTAAQIKQIEALRAKKKELEEIQELESKNQQKRIDAIESDANKFADRGMNPQELYTRTQLALTRDLAGGKITREQHDEASERAEERRDNGIDGLRREAQQMMLAAMTPLQRAQVEQNAELRKIAQLQEAGVVNADQATKLEDKARKDFEEVRRQAQEGDSALRSEADKLAQTGTFSAFGAGFIAQGTVDIDRKRLALEQKIEENTGRTVRAIRKIRLGFGP